MKKIFIIVICSISLILIASSKVFAIGTRNFSDINFNYDINDNFSDDSIIVIQNEKSSPLTKDLKGFEFKKIQMISKASNKKGSENNVFLISLNKKSKSNVLNTIEKLSNRDDVIYVGPNFINNEYNTIPNDTLYDYNEQAFNLISLPNAWTITTGSNSVKIGIIDSGIDYNFIYPELAQNYDFSLSRSFSSDGRSPTIDSVGHGTKVASVLASTSNNNYGTTGICWNCKFVSLKVSDYKGDFTSAGIIQAINYANEKGIPILNMSLAIECDLGIKTAIDNYFGLLVCAAGNDGFYLNDFHTIYPAKFDCENMIVVGSCSNSNIRSSFSNYSEIYVDLFAPGEQLVVGYNCSGCNSDLHLSNGFHLDSGTSFSSPIVAGVAGLLLTKYPYLTTNELKTTILNNVDFCNVYQFECLSGGRVNAYKALMNPYHIHNFDNELGICLCGFTNNNS